MRCRLASTRRDRSVVPTASEADMTNVAITNARTRTNIVAAHAYTIPVVRELPRPDVAAAGFGLW
jgi:hypothetical protein